MLLEVAVDREMAGGGVPMVRFSQRRKKPGATRRWRLPAGDWLTDTRRRRLGARRHLAQLVARRLDSSTPGAVVE
jgi:hypothetical protein